MKNESKNQLIENNNCKSQHAKETFTMGVFAISIAFIMTLFWNFMLDLIKIRIIIPYKR